MPPLTNRISRSRRIFEPSGKTYIIMAITASALPLVLRKASDIWPDNMTQVDFVPVIETLNAIKAEQTAQIQFANLPDGVDARITWMNNCDITADTCESACDFTGQEADTYNKDLEITQCKQSTFSVPLDAWRNNMFGMADAVAVNLNKAMKAHAEAVAVYAVGQINTFKGDSTYNNGGAWTLVTGDTTIPLAEWSSTAIFGSLRRAAIMNRLDNPFMLTGENLDQLIYMARTSQQNTEGRGDATRINEFRVYADLFNVDSVNTPNYWTYLIQRGALALASKAYFPTAPETLDGNTMRFSVRNRFAPELVHDVEKQVKCTSGVWAEHWRVKTKYELFLNPLGCTATRTGVLAFKRGV